MEFGVTLIANRRQRSLSGLHLLPIASNRRCFGLTRGDREPNASVVAVATPDVENGKRRRSCPQISLFVQVFSVQNIPDTCSVSCLSKCVADCQSLCCCRKRESCSSFLLPFTANSGHKVTDLVFLRFPNWHESTSERCSAIQMATDEKYLVLFPRNRLITDQPRGAGAACGLPPASWWLCGRDGVCSGCNRSQAGCGAHSSEVSD